MEKKNIYITGASGLVGRHLIYDFLTNTNYDIVAISSRPEVVANRYSNIRINSISYDDFLSLENDKITDVVNILIHCAFTRKNDSEELRRSLDLSKDILEKCVELEMDGVLNMSSRSIYKEPNEGCLNTEESELYLGGMIVIGKYSVELMVDSVIGMAGIAYSNLRLASVNELKTDNNMVRPLNVFVEKMISGNPINVVGGMQVMSYIDPRDVASAIRSLLQLNPNQWRSVYNIGTGWLCTDTLYNMAKLVVACGVKKGLSPVDICVEEKIVNQHAGLDISRITEDTGWIPQVSLKEMIDSLYEMKLGGNKSL
jgi:nucleoside-diphosphate-sugar epimerase